MPINGFNNLDGSLSSRSSQLNSARGGRPSALNDMNAPLANRNDKFAKGAGNDAAS